MHSEFFRSSFKLDNLTKTARLDLKNRRRELACEGFLKDSDNPNAALSFNEAATRLDEKIMRVDHVGLCVPRGLPAETWMRAVGFLAQTRCLYEYPNGVDGYDARKNLWYFMINTYRGWMDEPAPMTKFELVHDGIADHSIVQLDLKTKLQPAEAKALFPEGFSIEGLENYFWSVPVSTPWPGMRTMRLDIRFNDNGADGARWENGLFFLKDHPQLIRARQVRAPAFISQPA